MTVKSMAKRAGQPNLSTTMMNLVREANRIKLSQPPLNINNRVSGTIGRARQPSKPKPSRRSTKVKHPTSAMGVVGSPDDDEFSHLAGDVCEGSRTNEHVQNNSYSYRSDQERSRNVLDFFASIQRNNCTPRVSGLLLISDQSA